MRTNARMSTKSVTWDGALCALGIFAAAVAPFLAAHFLVETSSAEEIGYVLLVVAAVALALERRL